MALRSNHSYRVTDDDGDYTEVSVSEEDRCIMIEQDGAEIGLSLAMTGDLITALDQIRDNLATD